MTLSLKELVTFIKCCIEVRTDDKNETIEQLNQAKDFLETTNSNLLVKNIKMQLFLEQINVDVESGNY